jgi:transposase
MRSLTKTKIMSNKPISMNKLKQVIRLHGQGKGIKSISSILGIARNTIKKYLYIFHTSGMSYEQFFSMNDSELFTMFQVKPLPKPNQRALDLETILPELCKQLKRKGVTRAQLYKQYLEKHSNGFGRTRFFTRLQLYLAQSHPIMHIEHKAGEKMYIDFAGDKLYLSDKEEKRTSIEVFVAILGCSQLTYVEAVCSQKKEDLIHACENALHYFGGVPRAIVPDNMRSAVTKGSKYEAIINLDFANFAEHYNTTVIPARAYKPRDKSLVEGAVKLIYKNIYTKLDHRVFHDIESLNAAIRTELEVHNNTPFSGRNYSRREQFEEIEREMLGKLNPFRYQIKEQSIVTVMKNGHVRLSKDAHYYSVPYQYIGRKVKILYAGFDVEIYYQYELIAKHQRKMSRWQYTTDPKHLASHHQFLTEWSPEVFLKRAIEIDEIVAAYIAKVLERKAFPEQAYKSCNGILNFARRVGYDRLINACCWADSIGQYSYIAIEEILQKHLDKLKPEVTETEIPLHKNIRGKEYYK